MTLWDILRASVRRWPVVLAGVVVTAIAGLLAIREPSVYYTRMQVVFLAPSSWYQNVLQATPEAVIVTASAVVKRAIGPGSVIKFNSLDATIIGTTSASEGVWIRAEDRGGQWAPNFDTPIVVVDVVAPTAERVRELQYESIRRLQDELDKLQGELQRSNRDLITMEVAPNATVITNVRGNRARSLGATGLLGGSATLAAIVLLDWRGRRRQQTLTHI